MNQTPTERASRWLAQFGSAVAAPDTAGAAALFHDESYWRDLVSFTWNVKTMEGAGRLLVTLEFQHGGEQRQAALALEAQMADAARRRRLEPEPGLDGAIDFCCLID